MPPTASMMSNRNSIKPASVASISGPQDELNTHLGLLPSSPNILVLPSVSIPSRFALSSPISPGGDSPRIDVRDLVSATHAVYAERQALADSFVVNHPSRGVIFQKGWITLLAECAQLLIDAQVCSSIDEAVAAIKAICDGGVEEIETEEDFEVEIDVSDTDTDKTPVIEEEPDLEAEYDENPLKPHRVSQLSRSSSVASNSSNSARNRLRNSDRSASSAGKLEDAIDEEEDKMPPLRTSRSTIDLHLGRSSSQASMRESMVTPPPGAMSSLANGANKRRSGMGRDGKRFPVRAASMDNLSGIAALSVVQGDKRASTVSNGAEPRYSFRESIIVAERRRILEEKLAEERTTSPTSKRPLSEVPEPLNLKDLKDKPFEKRKSQFQHTRSASQKGSRDSVVSSTLNNSPRMSAQSFDSRSSTPTRWSDEIPKKRTKKIMERRKVKTIKTHPPLKFQEDVMLFLQNTETSPTFTKLIDAISVTINSIPSTPYTPSFPSPSITAYPSPPISPTTPTIVVEQANEQRASLSSVTSAPRLSLFPRPKTRDSDTKDFDMYSELLKTRSEPPNKELPPIPTSKLITPVKKINAINESPLNVQNEIRGILGDRMTAVRKFPTVVQGLALGMGLGLGLLNGGGEALGNKFWAPVLGGNGFGASVDMIFAVGFERGCEKWGQKLVQRITAGIGRCGPAHCVSLSYLLSLSLRQLNPSSPNYTSQVHAALSGKHLVPQLEDYLSVNTNTRCLVITFDAATIPNANLEPIRELRRVLDGNKPDSVFKIVSVIGGPVNGEEEMPTLQKEPHMTHTKNFSKPYNGPKPVTYRITPVPTKAQQKPSATLGQPNGSPNTSPKKDIKKSKSTASLRADEKTLMRRRELEAISNLLIVQKPDDNDAFEAHITYISSLLREREEKTGAYKAFENAFDEDITGSGSEYSFSSNEETTPPAEEEEEEEEEDDDFEVSYNDHVMSVGSLPRQHKSPSTWSKMWSREILGKKKNKTTGPNNCGIQEANGSAKAFKLLGLDN